MFRFLILGLLRDGTARHGYALMREYENLSGVEVSTGSVYRELQSLAPKGLVAIVASPDTPGQRQLPYRITDAGRVAFDTWLSDPGDPMSGKYESELSTRALFLAGAGPEIVREVLDRWKDDLLLRAKRIERDRKRALAQDQGASSEAFAVLPILLARRLKRVATDLEFIEEIRSAYDEWARKVPPKVLPLRRRS